MSFHIPFSVLSAAIVLAIGVAPAALAVQQVGDGTRLSYPVAPGVAHSFDSNDQTQSHLSQSHLSFENVSTVPWTQPPAFVTQELRNERPTGIPIGLRTEWLTDSDVGLATAGVSLKAPLLRGFGSPPPIIKLGFDYTNLFASDSFGLPDDLYEYSLGVSWVRRINDRWAVRTMLGTAFATDHQNTSSDAWQFRGGAFGIYERSPQWKWTIGAIALGRSDLPVLPAVGAIWQPTARTRFDLTLPTLKSNYLLFDDGQRQQWMYLGVGLSGTTWGYEQPDGTDDQLSYGDWRVLAGWESRPTPPPGKPFAIGRKKTVSIGYAFSRDLEFENETVEAPLANTFLIRVSTSY